MFVDRIKVFAQAGKGGRGSVSFRREKFVPKGGPDGGDGGRGGDVILRADRHVDNLSNLFYEPIIKAKNGGHGMGKKMAGRAGADKVVKVPIGTLVWAAEEQSKKRPRSNSDQLAIGNRQSTSHWSISLGTNRSLCFVAVEQGVRATSTSKVRETARRANIRKVKRASRDIFSSSCERLRTRGSSVIRMRANRHCCEKSRLPDRRLQHIRSRPCTRSSA